MPPYRKRRKYRKKSRKRTIKKRRRRTPYKKRSFRLKRRVQYALSRTALAMHTYSCVVSINPRTLSGVTIMDTHTFRANALLDPDYSGAGDSPRMFDEMHTHYRDYIVLSSTMQAFPIHAESTHKNVGYSGIRICKYPDDDNPFTDGPVTTRTLLENGYRCNKNLSIHTTNAAQVSRAHKLFAKYSAVKAFGKTFRKDPDFTRTALYTESNTALNPDKKYNYYFILWALNDLATGDSVNQISQWRVIINYKTLWKNRKPFSAS